VGLELGGKDPAYVRADVDVKWAAEEIVDGSVFNSGQSCCAVERVYVDEKIHDEFVAAIQDVLKSYNLGDPRDKGTHLGPVISKRSKEAILTHIKDALDKGATNATPYNESFELFTSEAQKGNFVAPTLLIHVDHSMAVMKEETFGPVIPVMKVNSDEEAIKLMNDSDFGLTASVWTKDTDKARVLVDQIEAGTVFVNRSDYPSPVSFPMELIQPTSSDRKEGSRLDRLEELWQGRYPEPVRFRAIRQAEELPPQGLSQIENRKHWWVALRGRTKGNKR
jgi:acyl-CoA reductase-like NAD-dependent aldehyde dehydrogenase